MKNTKYNILLCDGNEVVHHALKVESKDYPEINLLNAHNGTEAIRLWVKNKIDLVVIDPLLDHYSGIEIIQYIRDRNAAVPILLLTAQKSDFIQIKAHFFNIERIITKPFNPMAVCKFCTQILMMYH